MLYGVMLPTRRSLTVGKTLPHCETYSAGNNSSGDNHLWGFDEKVEFQNTIVDCLDCWCFETSRASGYIRLSGKAT